MKSICSPFAMQFFLIIGNSCELQNFKVELPGVKGIWTVYHKSSRGHNSETSKIAAEEDEFHAYLIISLEARTMVKLFLLSLVAVEVLKQCIQQSFQHLHLVSATFLFDCELLTIYLLCQIYYGYYLFSYGMLNFIIV